MRSALGAAVVLAPSPEPKGRERTLTDQPNYKEITLNSCEAIILLLIIVSIIMLCRLLFLLMLIRVLIHILSIHIILLLLMLLIAIALLHVMLVIRRIHDGDSFECSHDY